MQSDGKLVDQAIEVLHGGYKENAQTLLTQAITINPDNPKAWLWLSGTLTSETERRYCLERVLTLDPDNEMAQRAIQSLSATDTTRPSLLDTQKSAASSLSTTDGIHPSRALSASDSSKKRSAPSLPQNIGPREWILLAFAVVVVAAVVYIVNSAFFSDRPQRIATIQTQTAQAIASAPHITDTITMQRSPAVADNTQESTASPPDSLTTTTTPLNDTHQLTTTQEQSQPASPEPSTVANVDATEEAATLPTSPATENGAEEPAAPTASPTEALPLETTPTEPAAAENVSDEPTDSSSTEQPSTEQPSVLAEVDGYIANGGNMRSQPWIAANNVLGQVCPGDQIVILEQQAAWVHFRVVWLANDCHPDRVEQDTGGWASSTLIATSSFTPEDDYPVMPQGLQPAIVTDIVDGDAINVTIAGEPDLIRLVGIDTPDKGQCFQPEAAARTAELTLEQFVLLQPDESQGETNRFDQTLRHVWLPDRRLVALELIQEGYGFPFNDGKPYAYEERFEQAEQAARENERGFWSTETCGGER